MGRKLSRSKNQLQNDKGILGGKRTKMMKEKERTKQNRDPNFTRKTFYFFPLIALILYSILDKGFLSNTKTSIGPYEAYDGENASNLRSIWQNYVVLETISHDPKAFTQGLTMYNGRLFESTGLNGHSQVREVNPKNGKVLATHSLDEKFFGEGLTHFKDSSGRELLIQITWKSNVGFIYDPLTLRIEKEFTFNTFTNEGWGITFDQNTNMLIVSDGSEWLHFWDCDTLHEVKRFQVMLRKVEPEMEKRTNIVVRHLNELEFVNGKVLANVWYKDVIVSIDPKTGIIDRMINFEDLYIDRDFRSDCFNGISKTEVDGELLVTGKFWPHMYRIKLL